MQEFFLEAVKEGNLEFVTKMLEKDKNLISCKDKEGLAAIHWAAFKGHQNMVKYLVQAGANIKAKTNDGRSVLHLAATSVSDDGCGIIQFLAKLGADVNEKSSDGFAPLHLALWNAIWPALPTLVALGANIDAQDNAGRTALHLAGQQGFWEARQLLELGANPNIKANNGNTYLHEMVATDGAYMLPAEELSEVGADIYIRNQNGETALDIAIKNSKKEAVEFLKNWKSFKPDLNSYYSVLIELKKNKLKELSLTNITNIANLKHPSAPKLSQNHKVALLNGICRNSSLESLSLSGVRLITFDPPGILLGILIEILNKHPLLKKLDLRETGLIDETIEQLTSIIKNRKIPCNIIIDKLSGEKLISSLNLYLYEAVIKNDIAEIRRLIKRGANPNAVGDNLTCLTYAAAHEKFELVQLLIELGAKADFPEKEEWTPFAYAALNGHLKIADFLLQKGANMHPLLESGERSSVLNNILLYQDESENSLKSVKFLLDAGIDCTVKTSEGENALDIAIKSSKNESAGLIKQHMQIRQEQLKKDMERLQAKEKSLKKREKHKKNKSTIQIAEPKKSRSLSIKQTAFHIPNTQIEYGQKLGEGGFGEVYKATWNHNDVAVKKLLLKNLSDSAVQDFEKEINIHLTLRSPQVVQMYGVTAEQPYGMVMEYMENGSLDNFLRKTSRENFSWTLRYKIALDTSIGLLYLHQNQIIHRDLKSLNILLDQHNKAKLADFGLAKLRAETASRTQINTGLKGTSQWTAPELFISLEPEYNEKTDIFSFGIILWELASHEYPYRKASQHAISHLVVQGTRETFPIDTPKNYAMLGQQCWDGKAEKRPTVNETIKALKEMIPLSESNPNSAYLFSSTKSIETPQSGYLVESQIQPKIQSTGLSAHSAYLPNSSSSLGTKNTGSGYLNTYETQNLEISDKRSKKSNSGKISSRSLDKQDKKSRKDKNQSSISKEHSHSRHIESKKLPPIPSPKLPEIKIKEEWTALYDFETQEKGYLSFKTGEAISISEKIGDWWSGELNGKKGLVPSNYIELKDKQEKAQNLINSSPKISDNPSNFFALKPTYNTNSAKPLQAPKDEMTKKDLASLLKWVTEGHLLEVEKLLQRNSQLAYMIGTVTDLSGRTFKDITVFQYAAWAQDIEMCELSLKYLDKQRAAEQLTDLEVNYEKYSKYGAHYDISIYTTKLGEYNKNCSSWSYQKCDEYWQKEVGGAQRQFPAWLVYAIREEGENVAWVKKDLNNIKVTRQYNKDHLTWWFEQEYYSGKLGDKWAAVRGSLSSVQFARPWRALHDHEVGQSIKLEKQEAVNRLRIQLSSNNITLKKF